MTTNAPGNNVCTDSLLQRLENRRFTYKDLEKITNNFQRVLGRGGFGYVYDGFLEDGNQVAVKLRSHSSHQGVKEFLAEVYFLSLNLMFPILRDFGVKFDKLYMNIYLGSNFDTDSSQESCLHDWLLQGWRVHGTCVQVYVGRNTARAY
mgnify:CR=1 FL=1